MKQLKISVLALIAAATFNVSCSNDYLDINENPNSIHAEDITPKQMLPGAISQAYRIQSGPMMQFGNLMINSWAGNSYSFGSPFQREFNLGSVDNTFYSGIWGGLYPRIANFAQIERYPNADKKQDNYVAIAKIMKAYYMQYIVDLYGDAPYSEAFLGQLNMTPKYDNDADIYRSLINGLNEANALIDGNHGEAVVSDIVFNGSMANWKKFSNTLKLRMLLRINKVTGDMATFRDAQLATLVGASFVDTDVTENPGYSASNDDSMNPFVLGWARNSAISQVQDYSLVVVSEHMANALEGNAILGTPEYSKFTGLKDPRRSRLWTTVTGVQSSTGTTFTGLKGVRQGAVPGQPGAPTYSTATSKLGIGNFAGGAAVAAWVDVVNANNARGGVLMSKAESLLLQAEASLRYPTVVSAAQGAAAFNNAILAHGNWVGASATAAGLTALNAYITQANLRPGLGWVGTDAQKIEAIMTQKWIALTNVNPTEMFIEYNRTGMPWTPMPTTAQYPNRPYRLIYPVSEYAANAGNVPNISSAQAFAKNQYTPFWNQ